MKPIIKRSIFVGIFICLLSLTGSQAWGSPHSGIAAAIPVVQEPQQQQPQQEQPKSTTFMGTIVKDGELFVLRDNAGEVYKLDNSADARQFEGKAVKVTGRLDTEAKLIHVDSIEAANA